MIHHGPYRLFRCPHFRTYYDCCIVLATFSTAYDLLSLSEDGEGVL